MLAPAAGLADTRVAVRVVEVAGGRAYLEPGAGAGLQRGSVVRLRGKRFTVLAVTAAHAVVDAGDTPLAAGDRGDADAAAAGEARAGRPQPEPLSRYAGQWPEPRWPAAAQKPRFVPLGAAAGAAVQLTLGAQSYVLVPRAGTGDVTGHIALDGQLHVEPWRALPLGLDADAAALVWLSGSLAPVAGAQPNADVRELRLRYGDARDPFAALGRLRWAARSVGLLDGVRLRTPAVAGLSLAAFGGFVPDVVSGRPATDAARFGAELAFDTRALHATLTGWGSTFGGAVDERHLAAAADASVGPLRFDALAELGLFDADNPWGMAQLALVAASAGAALHAGPWRADLRAELRQPERSRYLASILPAGYLCSGVPDDACGSQLRLGVTGGAGFSAGHLALDAGGSFVGGYGDATEATVFGDALLRRLFGHGRLGVEVSATNGSFLDERALRVDAGVTFITLDVGAHWRGAMLDYTAATATRTEHRVGVDAVWSQAHDPELGLSIEGATGADVDALVILATVIWRPLP
jgi:hypothetical protein